MLVGAIDILFSRDLNEYDRAIFISNKKTLEKLISIAEPDFDIISFEEGFLEVLKKRE